MPDQTAELYRGRIGSWDDQVAARDRVHWMCRCVKGQRVLDLGCGSGLVCTLLAREGFHVVGVDSDKEMIGEAETHLQNERRVVADRVTLRVADAYEIEESDELFDTVVIRDLCDAVTQPERVLDAAKKVLAEDGLLVLTCAFGRQFENPAVRGLRLVGLTELLIPEWTIHEADVRKGSLRLVAGPRKDPVGAASGLPFGDDLLKRAEREQRALEVALYRASVGSVERLKVQQERLDRALEERDATRLEVEGSRKAASELKGEFVSVGRSLEDERIERDRLKSKVLEAEAEIARARRRREQLLERRRAAETKVERFDETLRSLEPLLPELESQKVKLEREVEQLHSSLDRLTKEHGQLRRLRARFDEILDRAAPGPGAPSARLGRLLDAHRKLEHLHSLMMTGIRRKIGDVFIKAARPSLDTLLLPARLVTLFAEGRQKALTRQKGPLPSRASGSHVGSTEKPKQLSGPAQRPEVPEAAVQSLTWGATDSGKRVCVYAEVNPNLIDGSSIWLASLLETFALNEELRLTVLLGQSITRPAVLGHLRDHARIRFVVADDLPGLELEGSAASRRKLTPTQAVRALMALDELDPQSVFVIRGPGIYEGDHILDAVIGEPELARRTWAYLVDPTAYDRPVRRENLKRAIARCRRILCQTPEALEILLRETGDIPRAADRLSVLPPMIPSVASKGRRLSASRALRLGYAGKLSPPYRILEMLSAFTRIRETNSNVEFHVIGDKIHNAPKVEGFEEAVRRGLETTPGVVWHGGVSRARTIELLGQVDVASSWRDGSFDQSSELSTKVLEYAGLGIPVLLNPTPLQRSLFGKDYPAYVEDEESFMSVFQSLTSDASLYQEVSERVLRVASEYTFGRTAEKMLDLLLSDSRP